jgi:hypothetical protein
VDDDGAIVVQYTTDADSILSVPGPQLLRGCKDHIHQRGEQKGHTALHHWYRRSRREAET